LEKEQGVIPIELREPTVQEKAAEVGLSMARLARESRVNYHRIQHGYALMGDEEGRIEAVLDHYAFRRRTHPDRAVV
jgi:hypothetical protein